MKKKHKPTRLEKFAEIVNNIKNIIPVEYLQFHIGQTHVKYLLIYVVGLILLDRYQNAAGMASQLLVCCHDSLCRMLAQMNFSQTIFSGFMIFVIRMWRQNPGYLILDDTCIVKKFSKMIPFCSYGWCSSIGRLARGMHVVVLYWCDGTFRFPVAFHVWSSKKVRVRNYKKKSELAYDLILKNLKFCQSCNYLVFDSWYCGKRFLKEMRNLDIHCVSALPSNRNVIFNKQKIKVSDLDEKVSEKLVLPGVGEVLFYSAKIGKNQRYLISTDLSIDKDELKRRYKSRWEIEKFFRFIKQNLGFEKCQCRKHNAVINHISSVFIAFTVLEIYSKSKNVKPEEAKRNFQAQFYEHDQKMPSLPDRKEIFFHDWGNA